jgi:crossover junction endodeoxyribonuclease RuvC
MNIIGIDPGKKGAIVAMVDGEINLHQMPEDAGSIVEILTKYMKPSCHVFLEKSQAMPGQGTVSMFNYGTGFGTLLGILAALKIPHTLVHPKTWCKVMHSGTTLDDAKARSLEAARRLFPHVQLVRPRCTKPDEGYIDALLIAEYGKRCLKG